MNLNQTTKRKTLVTKFRSPQSVGRLKSSRWGPMRVLIGSTSTISRQIQLGLKLVW
jgi:hypothetical protein